MEKLTSIARKIDIVFKIADVMLKIAFVVCLVVLGIIIVGAVFDLPEEMIGEVTAQVELGPVTLQVADGVLPGLMSSLPWVGLECALGAAASFVGILCVKAVSGILAPMKEGKPFAREISRGWRRLGWLSLILGVVTNVMKVISLYSMAATYNIGELLISDKITHVSVNASVDLSFLIIPVVFFLLAYVFRYGEELQTLSDETV
ncbi:MAG: hypothetical protein IJA83_11560 [Clostridia bacterium]|nr:hypothetical protein [Clostridia bacterium]